MQKLENDNEAPNASSWALVAIAWALVGVPLGWGIWVTLQNAARLFH